MRPSDTALAVAGFVLFETSRVVAARPTVHVVEERTFRIANDAADGLRVPVRTVMQAGTLAAAPVMGAILFVTGRRRVAARVFAAGTAAWALAKAAKPLAGRPRPALVMADVRIRESIAGDLGWVSGHAAVSTAIGLTLAPSLPPAAGPVLACVVATTAFGRMFVGAHLPLDLVGGAGLGMVIAAVVR